MPLVSKEDMLEAGVISDLQGNPLDFEGELLFAMKKRGAEVNNILKTKDKASYNISKIDLSNIRLAGWEDYFEFGDNKDREMFMWFIGKSNVELNSSHKSKRLGYLLEKAVSAGNKIIIRKKDIGMIENLFIVLDSIKSQKDLYLAGKMYEYTLFPEFHNVEQAGAFFSQINDVDNFDTVVHNIKGILGNGGVSTSDVMDIYRILLNLGADYLNDMILSAKKLEELKNTSVFENNNIMHTVSNGSLIDALKNDPYICRKLSRLSIDSILFGVGLLKKIHDFYVDLQTLIYLLDFLSEHRNQIESEGLDSKFSSGMYPYFSPIDNLMFALYAPDVKNPDLLPRAQLSPLEDQVEKAFLEEEMPFLQELADYFGISEKFSSGSFGVKMLNKLNIEGSSLMFLVENPSFKEFIRDNFEVSDLKMLSKISKIVIENRNDSSFNARIRATSNLESSIKKHADKKVSELFFLSKSYDVGFINWLCELYRKTGFDVFNAFNYGYYDTKISSFMKWYNDQKSFKMSVENGLLGGNSDNQLGEYTSNIYKYDTIKLILDNQGLLEFINSNNDIGMLAVTLRNNSGGLIAKTWYDDQKTFHEAKFLGLFEKKEIQYGKNNLENYTAIRNVMNDKGFLEFLLKNGILQIAIDSNYGIDEWKTRSIDDWFKDKKSFDVAKRLGIIGGEFDDCSPGNLCRYDRLKNIGRLDSKDEKELSEILDSRFSNEAINNIDNIIPEPEEERKSLMLRFFVIALEAGLLDEGDTGLTINKGNFIDYLADDEPLLFIEKDRGSAGYPIPWSKRWFMEDVSRFSYLNKNIIETFKKFGTNIALALLGGTKDVDSFNEFYSGIIGKTNRKNERSTILQLGEIFSIIISKGNYEILDLLVERSVPAGDMIKDFVMKYAIGSKGKTIVTLMFAREVNIVRQSGIQESLKSIVGSVYKKLTRYNEIISKYDAIPEGLKVSVGMEYEVTKSIAKGYEERTASDYKQDIEILSCYSGIAKGNDAIHEIATRPADNPYLLLLEMKLLNDLDFIDLNFEHHDYERGSRSFHITSGGEFGIIANGNANFIQNIIIAADLGGINTGRRVEKLNRFTNIRDRNSDCEDVFGNGKTPTTEFRALSIDRAEPFERCILSFFNLNLAKQMIEKYTNIKESDIEKLSKTKDAEEFESLCEEFGLVKEKIEYKAVWDMMHSFVKLQAKVIEATIDNNEHFFHNEAFNEKIPEDFKMLVNGLMYGAKEGMKLSSKYLDLDFRYIKDLCLLFPMSQEVFYDHLEKNGRIKPGFESDKQMRLIYLWFKKYVAEPIQRIKKKDEAFYERLDLFFANSNSISSISNRLENHKRFESIIAGEIGLGENLFNEYLEQLRISKEQFYEVVTPEFVNSLTSMHNLFLKPPTSGINADCVNANSVFENTRIDGGQAACDMDAPKRTVFDCIDQDKEVRKGNYVIQGSTEYMLINRIQQSLSEFNDSIFASLEVLGKNSLS